jgi:hypothetical protein
MNVGEWFARQPCGLHAGGNENERFLWHCGDFFCSVTNRPDVAIDVPTKKDDDALAGRPSLYTAN